MRGIASPCALFMNIILVESQSEVITLGVEDPRAKHICSVLRTPLGGEVYLGVVDGPRGVAKLKHMDAQKLVLTVDWEDGVTPLHPVHWLIGLPRPQTARKLLQAGSILGVSSIHFFQSEKGEPAYAKSKLWCTDEWQRHLMLGAEQAFATNFPKIHHSETLDAALNTLAPLGNATRLALDVYEADEPLGVSPLGASSSILAFGPERGWSPNERDGLRGSGFTLKHLGSRVLRSELAATAATAIVLTQLGAYKSVR